MLHALYISSTILCFFITAGLAISTIGLVIEGIESIEFKENREDIIKTWICAAVSFVLWFLFLTLSIYLVR